jgi:hypothetical protein
MKGDDIVRLKRRNFVHVKKILDLSFVLVDRALRDLLVQFAPIDFDLTLVTAPGRPQWKADIRHEGPIDHLPGLLALALTPGITTLSSSERAHCVCIGVVVQLLRKGFSHFS